MNTLKLLPRWCRIAGLLIIIPVLGAFFYNPEVAFGDAPIFNEPDGSLVFNVPSLLDSDNDEFSLFAWIKNDLTNELLLTLMLIGTWLVAFAKIKGEDEFSGQLRLEAMVSAIIYNSILLLVLNFIVYDGLFLYVMISQLFSFLLLFSFIFALKVRKQRKALGYEE